MHHVLKTDPAVFRAVRDGVKNFEVRKDDRAFQAGDTVELTYYDRERESSPFAPPTPFDKSDDKSSLTRKIGFVLRGGQYGLEPGYVAFSLFPVEVRSE
jgi:hypothetical protein